MSRQDWGGMLGPASAPPVAATAASTAAGNAEPTGAGKGPDTYQACPVPQPLTSSDPSPDSHIFDQLSLDETNGITDYMVITP